jgi:hypothetical protein
MAQSRPSSGVGVWHMRRAGRKRAEEARMVRSIVKLASVWVAVGALHASVAHAQDVEPDDEKSEKAKEEKGSDEDKAKPEKPAAEEASADTGSKDNSPVEEQGKTYRFIGARYRAIIVPEFMLHLFADGGTTVVVHSFGPEFAIRKDAFEYNLAMWLAFYSMDDTPFKGKSDGVEAWEIVSASTKILYLTSDFMWTHQFSPQVGLNYGVGAGFGIVFGDIHRNQAYPPGGNAAADPSTWQKCAGVGNPPFTNGATPFCDNSNDHYGNYTEPSWANGGSKPILFPWLMLQTGLRYKPVRSFAGRLDLGFGTSGFMIGIGGDYGLPD